MVESYEADRDEIRRYLGQRKRGDPLPPELEELMEDCIREAAHIAQPRSIVTPPLPLTNEGESLYAGPLPLSGESIRAHLKGCRRVVLMASTLGATLDRLIRKTEVLDMTRAVILDAVGNEAIEREADRAEEELRSSLWSHGLYLTGRFSPGYGDFPLKIQTELLRLVGGPEKLGLTAGQSCILTPRKSITAVLGVAEYEVTGHRAGCSCCLLRDKCVYRKRGTTCE